MKTFITFKKPFLMVYRGINKKYVIFFTMGDIIFYWQDEDVQVIPW